MRAGRAGSTTGGRNREIWKKKKRIFFKPTTFKITIITIAARSHGSMGRQQDAVYVAATTTALFRTPRVARPYTERFLKPSSGPRLVGLAPQPTFPTVTQCYRRPRIERDSVLLLLRPITSSSLGFISDFCWRYDLVQFFSNSQETVVDISDQERSQGRGGIKL